MSSTLPSSNFSSDFKFYPNDSFTTLENTTQFNSNNDMHYGLTMWLDQQQDCLLPFSNNNNNNNNNNNLDINNFLVSTSTNNIDGYSPNSNSMIHIPSLENSYLESYNNHLIKGRNNNSSGSINTYDEFESNAYDMFQSYVPSSNNYVAATPQCWGFQGHTTQICGTDSSNNNIKVGRYSVEEKKDRILRYLKKRNQRNFRKTIKYACRKTLADRRVRIRGRFAKNQEEESSTNYNHSEITHHEDPTLQFPNDDLQKEENGEINEEWIQEAMSNLLYVPYISGWHPD